MQRVKDYPEFTKDVELQNKLKLKILIIHNAFYR